MCDRMFGSVSSLPFISRSTPPPNCDSQNVSRHCPVPPGPVEGRSSLVGNHCTKLCFFPEEQNLSFLLEFRRVVPDTWQVLSKYLVEVNQCQGQSETRSLGQVSEKSSELVINRAALMEIWGVQS